MNTKELTELLISDPAIRKHFRGVFAADEQPRGSSWYPCAYVFNTDTKNKSGSHWIALYAENKEQVAYFDSYGIHPFGSLYKFAKTLAEDVVYNTKWLQGPTTWVCGAYCVYFLHFRCRGYTFKDILGHFDQYDWRNNDNLVSDVVRVLRGEN